MNAFFSKNKLKTLKYIVVLEFSLNFISINFIFCSFYKNVYSLQQYKYRNLS